METSEVTEFSDMKGLSVKVIGDDRSVSVDTKEICDDENIKNNDDDNDDNDDDDSIDYVPVSEQIEPMENGKSENDVEMKHENGVKDIEKEKNHTQDKGSEDLEENFQPDYEPTDEAP